MSIRIRLYSDIDEASMAACESLCIYNEDNLVIELKDSSRAQHWIQKLKKKLNSQYAESLSAKTVEAPFEVIIGLFRVNSLGEESKCMPEMVHRPSMGSR